jgi:hypothetical protein
VSLYGGFDFNNGAWLQGGCGQGWDWSGGTLTALGGFAGGGDGADVAGERPCRFCAETVYLVYNFLSRQGLVGAAEEEVAGTEEAVDQGAYLGMLQVVVAAADTAAVIPRLLNAPPTLATTATSVAPALLAT